MNEYISKDLELKSYLDCDKFLSRPGRIRQVVNFLLKKKKREQPVYYRRNRSSEVSELRGSNSNSPDLNTRSSLGRQTVHKGPFQIAGHSTGDDQVAPRIFTVANEPDFVYKLIDEDDIEQRGQKEREFYECFRGSSVLPEFFGQVTVSKYDRQYLKLRNVITDFRAPAHTASCASTYHTSSSNSKIRPANQNTCAAVTLPETSEFLVSFADVKIGAPLPSIARWSGIFRILNRSSTVKGFLCRRYIRFFLPCLDDHGFQLLGMKFYQKRKREKRRGNSRGSTVSIETETNEVPVRYAKCSGRGAVYTGHKFVIEKFLRTFLNDLELTTTNM